MIHNFSFVIDLFSGSTISGIRGIRIKVIILLYDYIVR
jgi:hypothetical protein